MSELERYTPSVEGSILAETRRFLAARGADKFRDIETIGNTAPVVAGGCAMMSVVEGYDDRWTWRYPTRALIHLEDVRRATTPPDLQAAVTQPTLVLVYDKDADNRDPTVSVDAARAAYDRFNGGQPRSGSRFVRIQDGSHVLLSEFVRINKDEVISPIRDFLRSVVGLPPRERALQAHEGNRNR